MSVWFVVPANGRAELTRVCLTQLARTCEVLTGAGVPASAVVIASDENLDTATELGFGTIERANYPLGRKWNDGYEMAAHAGVDYVIPFGTDDWIDPALVLAWLEAPGEFRCTRLSAVVREDGEKLTRLRITYDGGDGVRMIPVGLLRPLGYRPAEEDKPRAIDTSVLLRLTRALKRPPTFSYTDLHALQIVDWKSREQLNSYRDCALSYGDGAELDAFDALADVYPAEALEQMRALHGMVLV